MTKLMQYQYRSIHGHQIAFHISGQGPVLLLLHGMASCAETWEYIVPILSKRYTVVAPDMLGHGKSATPDREYSLGTHANIVRDLFSTLDHERATVVGHSFGGGVAMQLAYQYPELCQRLVLVGSGGLGQEVSPLLRTLALPLADQIFPLFCSNSLREIASNLFSMASASGIDASPHLKEMWRGYSSLTNYENKRAFFRTLRAVVNHEGQSVSAEEQLYLTEKMPTQIIWGDDDPIIPVSHAHDARELIRGSRLEVFNNVGHYPHCNAPEKFAEVLTDFIESTAEANIQKHEWKELLRRHYSNNNVAAA